MFNTFISYKDAVYEVLGTNICEHKFPSSRLFQVTISIREFKNWKNAFINEAGLYISDVAITEEQMIARTLFKNTLEIEDFYA